MYIKRLTQFILEPIKKDPTTARVRFRIKWSSSKNILAFSIPYIIELDKWNKEAQRCTRNTTHGKDKVPAFEINRVLEFYELATHDIFTFYEKEKKTPTVEEVRNALNLRIKNKSPEDDSVPLLDALNAFITRQRVLSSWTQSTTASHKSLSTNLKEFAPTAKLSDVDFDFLLKFLDFMNRNEMKGETIKRKLTYIKSVLKGLTDAGYNVPQDFKRFNPKIKTIDKKIIFLTKDELLHIYNIELQGTKTHVRDVFCFCAFTGLRISDALALTWTNIQEDTLTVVTQKTSAPLVIELNDFAKEILSRQDKTAPKVFRYFSTVNINTALKQIAKACDISTPITLEYYRGGERVMETRPKYELISTHTARRTFVCLALSMGISPSVVMKWTGHKNYESMKPYIDITNETKSIAMKLFNTLK